MHGVTIKIKNWFRVVTIGGFLGILFLNLCCNRITTISFTRRTQFYGISWLYLFRLWCYSPRSYHGFPNYS